MTTLKLTTYIPYISMKPTTTLSSNGFHPKVLFSTAKKHNASMTVKVEADLDAAPLT